MDVTSLLSPDAAALVCSLCWLHCSTAAGHSRPTNGAHDGSPWAYRTGSPQLLADDPLQTQTRSSCYYNNFIFTVKSQHPQSSRTQPGCQLGNDSLGPREVQPLQKGIPGRTSIQTEKAVQRQVQSPGQSPGTPELSTPSPWSLESGHSGKWRWHPAIVHSQSARCAYGNSGGKVVAVYQVKCPPH